MLRRRGSYNDGDIRHYGTHAAQQAMDKLLYSWAETTWGIPRETGKTFAMRVAATLEAAEQAKPDPFQPVDPQADWKYTANGKETNRRTIHKPDQILETVHRITEQMLTHEPLLFSTMCLHYGAYKYRNKVDVAPYLKALHLGIEDGAYRMRISRIRKYFLDKWPKGKLLQDGREKLT